MEAIDVVEESQESDDNELIEGAEYSPKSEFNKPLLCFQAVQRCAQFRAEEMRPGYFNTKLTKEGQAIKIWVPDARQKYIGAVRALQVILSPEIQRSKKYQDKEDKINEELESLFNTYAYEDIQPFNTESGFIWKKTNKKYIPAIDAAIKRPHPKNRHKIVYITGYWNPQTNQYLDEIVALYDELFAALNDLVDELNYFKQSVSF